MAKYENKIEFANACRLFAENNLKRENENGKQLKAENDGLVAQIISLNGEIIDVKKELEQSQETITNLRNEMKLSAQNIEEMKKERKKLLLEKASFKEKLRSFFLDVTVSDAESDVKAEELDATNKRIHENEIETDTGPSDKRPRLSEPISLEVDDIHLNQIIRTALIEQNGSVDTTSTADTLENGKLV